MSLIKNNLILLVTNILKQLSLDSTDTQRRSIYVSMCCFTNEFMSYPTTTTSTRSQQNSIFHVTTNNQIVLPDGRSISVNYSLVVVADWLMISFTVIIALKVFMFPSMILCHMTGTLDVFLLVGIHFCLGFKNNINDISITLGINTSVIF